MLTSNALVLMAAVTFAPAQGPVYPTSPGYTGMTGNPPRPIVNQVPNMSCPTYPIWYGQFGNPYYYNWWDDPIYNPPQQPAKVDSLVEERPSGGAFRPPVAPRVIELVPAPAPGTARITLEVPPEATVTCQGQPTQQTGAVRVFNTPVMTGPGEYTFVVSWKVGDQVREQTLTVPVSAGSTPTVRVVK